MDKREFLRTSGLLGLAAEEAAANTPGRISVSELKLQHPWLAQAVDLARSKEVGAWHWELEFAPVFQRGGFDLQVGNPPWVRPRWADDLTLAEFDPWWGIAEKTPMQAEVALYALAKMKLQKQHKRLSTI